MGERLSRVSQCTRGEWRKALLQEEQQFARTLQRGMSLLEDAVADLPEGPPPPGVLAVDAVFKLYDTYGFP